MIFKTHTLILSTPRLEIPDNPNIVELINSLVHNNLCNIEYFGDELDNQADFVDDSEQARIDSTTFITLHFDQSSTDDIDYNLNEESVLNLILTVISENQIKQVIVDEKDVDIYIY